MKKTMMFLGMLSLGLAQAQQYDEKVGINTDTPSATLNVKTKTNSKSPKNLELENQAGDKLVTVMNTSRVGLNTHNPEYILDIQAKDNSWAQSNIMLRTARGESPSQRFSGLLLQRANGLPNNLKKLEKGDYVSGIYAYGYNGSAHTDSYFINGIVTGDIDETGKVPTSIIFGVEGGKEGRAIYGTTPNMIIHHTGNVGINFQDTPVSGKSVGIPNTPLEKLHINGALKLTTEYGTSTITDGAKTPVPNGGEGTIIHQNGHFFGWVNAANGWKQLDNEKSTGATQLSGTEGIQCNEDNRGKMNFKRAENGKSDVFGVCLKNANGNYNWAYFIGGGNPTNGTGAFGSGL